MSTDATASTVITTSFTADDGIEIVYDVRGQDSGGRPPVVLHHGFAVNADINWVGPGIVAALTGAGRQVVTVDARGHGRSGAPHDPAFYGEDRMSRDLAQLVDVLGAAAYDLVGYSMGAIVSAITATRDERVRRLVIGGVGAGIVEVGGVDTRALPNDLLADALERDDPATITDPGVAGFRQLADAIGADRLALAAQARNVHAEPIPVERITAPTLVLVGDDDPLAVRPEVLSGRIPDARLVVVAGNHMSAVGAPAFVSTLVDFLCH